MGEAGVCPRVAIVLAGGEGTRLRDLTRKISGAELPKQFCSLIGNRSLLQQTCERMALAFDREAILVSLNRAHEPFYARPLAAMARQQLVVQPANLGTLSAVAYSLYRVAQLFGEAVVAIVPSDHYVSNDWLFIEHLQTAMSVAQAQPGLTILLGIAPAGPETAYGWIEPRPSEFVPSPCQLVKRFWEKPAAGVARELFTRGCLWNSFVMVARVSTLLELIALGAPQLCAAFRRLRPVLGTRFEDDAINALYAQFAPADLSQQILARFPEALAVLPVQGLEWSDLGESQRVMETLDRIGQRPHWAAA